jgi:preprotein translocase subunit SecA
MPSEWGARTGGLHFTAPTLDTAEGVVEGAFAAPGAGARRGRPRAGRRRKR